MSWSEIGFIFFFMLIPFVVLQYPAGRIADMYIGEKELIIFSLVIMAIFTAVIPFIKTMDWILWALVLFGTRVGAAIIDVLRDSYFYKKVDAHNVSLIDFFRTARPIGIITASGISFVLLLFFSMKAVFFLLVFILLLAFFPAFRLHDSNAE
jgi:MFS family permease